MRASEMSSMWCVWCGAGGLAGAQMAERIHMLVTAAEQASAFRYLWLKLYTLTVIYHTLSEF
jgi:hypothetical protein